MPGHTVKNSARKNTFQEKSHWQTLLNRDKTADGTFFYAVKTTGIYCRPSCGARTPKPENVSFYKTTQEAQQAGFRACKRCKPDEISLERKQTALIAKLCQYIEITEITPTLAVLAQKAQISPFHLQRLFKKVTGLTPKAYASAHRTKKMRHALKHSSSITEAIYDAGYNASSPFYAQTNKVLGMKPKNYRTGGSHEAIHFAIGQCSLGAILVAATDQGICAISLSDDPQELIEDLQDRFPHAELIGADSGFEQLIAKVVGFVEVPQTGLDLPLDIRGTAFQQRVWQALQQIPIGTTTNYSEIAKRIGAPKAFRAVANACAKNAIAIAIPCHRVVHRDGSISGYRWGVERKQALLKREGA